MKISSKISLSFFLVSFVLTSIFLPASYIKAKNSLQDNILAHLLTTVQSRANHIKTFLEEDKQRVRIIAESYLIESTVKKIIRNPSDSNKYIAKANLILKDFMNVESEANELFILNKNGKIIASTNEKSIGTDRSADSGLLEGMKNTFIKDAHYHGTSEIPMYTISTPIRDDDTKELLGVLVATFHMDGLYEITTERTGLGETGEIYIINKHGYMITPSRFKEDTFLKQKIDTENARNALLFEDNIDKHVYDIKDTTLSPDYRGIPVLGNHGYIEEMQWRLLAEIDAKEAFKPLIEMRNMLIIILFVMPISALLIGIFISRKIFGPIEKLSNGAEIIGSGNLDHKVGSDVKDEIGQLSRTFDQMTDNLKAVTASRDELNKEIIERKRAEEKLEQLAYYDQLTNLPNRDQIVKHIGRMLKHKQYHSNYMFAVLFIDLDRFKIINDSLGHIIGDKLLVEVARRLETCNRANDRTARFGGDEYAVFLDGIKDVSTALRVADRIQMELQKPFYLDGHELFTSASIGIALSATGYENAEDILRNADSAMYRAKDLGKGRYEIFDAEMHNKALKILQLEADLRRAVERKEFMVYYQPIVSAIDSRITGAEALLRWNHPHQGFISPTDFIPIAEEIGLISTIGEWVLRTACVQNKAWQDTGYPNLLMKVNFSSRQFKDKNLDKMVKEVIRETGMPAQLLDVEVTESIAMSDNGIEILNKLTAIGLQTSIDDFGIGYSSLGSLTRFPINTIKIDRSFIKDITIDVNAKAIVKAIIAMAHSLNMEVVAEGVETEDQLAFLQLQKCDKIQGYLFSPPVPEEDFRKLLEQDKIGPSPINKHSASMV